MKQHDPVVATREAGEWRIHTRQSGRIFITHCRGAILEEAEENRLHCIYMPGRVGQAPTSAALAAIEAATGKQVVLIGYGINAE